MVKKIPNYSAGMTLIETQSPSGVATITFSNLGLFTHLEIRGISRSDNAAEAVNLLMRFNADTGANYDYQYVRGIAATASAGETFAATSILTANIAGANATANYASGFCIKIFNYRDATFQKQAFSENSHRQGTASGKQVVLCMEGAWRNTAAITSIILTLASGNYVAGSKFSLYGLL